MHRYKIIRTINVSQTILLPRPLSNDPRFIQFIYHYSHASKCFVEVYYDTYLFFYLFYNFVNLVIDMFKNFIILF